MVQYIPGPESLLAPAAAQITEGVLNFLNPHRQFQQAVQAAIAQNPEVAQHFANLEAGSPGLLRSLGIGKLASIPATPEAQFAIKNREAIIGGAEAQLGAKTAQSLYTSDQIQKALALFQQDPSIGMDAALKFATGQTTAERAVGQLAGRQAEAGQAAMNIPGIYAAAGQKAATGQTPGEAAKDQFTSQTIDSAQEMLANGPEITIQKFLNNEYSPKQLLGIFGTPLGEALKQQLDFLNDQYRIRIMSGRSDDAMARLQYGKAFDIYTKINDPNVNIGDVLRAVNDPDILSKADEPGNEGIKAVKEGIARLQVQDVSKTVVNLDRDYTAALTAYRLSNTNKDTKGRKGDEVRRGYVATINQILAQKAMLPGQPKYTATFEPIVRSDITGKVKSKEQLLLPDTERLELVIRGPDGKIVDPDSVLGTGSNLAPKSENTPTAPQARGGITDKQLQGLVAQYKALPTEGEKAAQLARWQTSAPPEDFAKLKAALGIK